MGLQAIASYVCLVLSIDLAVTEERTGKTVCYEQPDASKIIVPQLHPIFTLAVFSIGVVTRIFKQVALIRYS